MIDDIGIWNRALTANEVTDLYNGTSSGPNCLVSYYPFNGNANDSTISANNGIVSGATLSSDRFGNANAAYAFNGAGDYIEIPNSSNYNGPEFSIAFWAKTHSSPTSTGGGSGVNPGIITKVNSTGIYPPPDGFYFYEIGGEANLSFGSIGGSITYTGAQNTFTDSMYHFFVFTYKMNDTIKYYVDNVLWYYSVGANMISNSEPIRLGTSNSPYWKSFEGIIDDVSIYNCALSDSEIAGLYNGIHENNSGFGFQISPNPSNSMITISWDHNLGTKALIEIFNNLGQTVRVEKSEVLNSTNIHVGELTAGVYFLRFSLNGLVSNNKFVVTH